MRRIEVLIHCAIVCVNRKRKAKNLPSNVPVYTRDTSYDSGPRVFSISTSGENIELGSSRSTTLNCLQQNEQTRKKNKIIREKKEKKVKKKTLKIFSVFGIFFFALLLLFYGISACI